VVMVQQLGWLMVVVVALFPALLGLLPQVV
jgi:hypothetical protein